MYSKPEYGNGICIKRGDDIINGTITGKNEYDNYTFKTLDGKPDEVGFEDTVLWAMPGIDNRVTDVEDDGYPD